MWKWRKYIYGLVSHVLTWQDQTWEERIERRRIKTCAEFRTGEVQRGECGVHGQGSLRGHYQGDGSVPFYNLDSNEAVPVNRPRLCWYSEKLEGSLEGLEFTPDDLRIWVDASNEHPEIKSWTEPAQCDPEEKKEIYYITCRVTRYHSKATTSTSCRATKV